MTGGEGPLRNGPSHAARQQRRHPPDWLRNSAAVARGSRQGMGRFPAPLRLRYHSIPDQVALCEPPALRDEGVNIAETCKPSAPAPRALVLAGVRIERAKRRR